ncbi:MAG: OFA family MFS transporter [Anaerolineae bacterium]
MAQERVMNRWLTVVGALMVQLILGVIYAFSVFVKPLEAHFGWDRAQTTWAFSINVATFAIVMVYGGRLQDRIGPRKVCMLGGALMGLGFVLAKFINSIPMFYLTYGVIAGAGIAFSYVTPIAVLVKWFPDMRGLMTGVAVAGFGFSTLIFGPVAARLIIAVGWQNTFLYLGILFLIVVVAGAQFLRNPPAGWLPEGYTPPAPATTTTGAVARVDYAPRELFSYPSAYMLWIMFAFHASAGLMVISALSPFAQIKGMTATAAAGVVGYLSIFNGAGRIIAGWVSDRIGRQRAMLLFFGLTGIVMFITPFSAGTTIGLLLAVTIIGASYGSNFALFPSTTADFFGTKNVGANYGLIFSAWGLAGVLGGRIGSFVFQATGAYTNAFYISGVLALIAAGLSLVIRAPAAAEAPAEA